MDNKLGKAIQIAVIEKLYTLTLASSRNSTNIWMSITSAIKIIPPSTDSSHSSTSIFRTIRVSLKNFFYTP